MFVASQGWVNVTQSNIPFTVNASEVPLQFTPAHADISSPSMCSAQDTFSAIASNTGTSVNADSAALTVTLQLRCDVKVCPAGTQMIQSQQSQVQSLL